MTCSVCGEPSDFGICDACLFIRNHPEVVRNDMDFAFWLGVEIDAMEQALDKTLFRREADGLARGIQKANRKLKKLKKSHIFRHKRDTSSYNENVESEQ